MLKFLKWQDLFNELFMLLALGTLLLISKRNHRMLFQKKLLYYNIIRLLRESSEAK